MTAQFLKNPSHSPLLLQHVIVQGDQKRGLKFYSNSKNYNLHVISFGLIER